MQSVLLCLYRLTQNSSLVLILTLQSCDFNLIYSFLGEDADLCSEVLQESLDALRSLPEATLFDEASVSPVWLEVVERSAKFLKQVVLG